MKDRLLFFLRSKFAFLGVHLVAKNNNSVKWGIVGTGYMSNIIATSITYNKNSVLHAVSSRSLKKAKQFSKKYGKCLYFESHINMIKDNNLKLDVIYIATPKEHHYSIIKDCLINNKNVICEKPITTSTNELIELQKIANEHNCFLMEAMWMKLLPTFSKGRLWINQGIIGDLKLIKVDFYKEKKISVNNKSDVLNSKLGVLEDYGIYAISFLTEFINDFPEKLKFFSVDNDYGMDMDWNIVAIHNDIKAFINISSNFKGKSVASISGTKGTIVWDSQFNRTNKITLYNRDGEKLKSFTYPYKVFGFEYQVNEVNNCIQQSMLESPRVTLRSSILSIKIMELLIKRRNSHECQNFE